MNMIRSAKNQIAELTAAAYRAAVQEGLLPEGVQTIPAVEIPKDTANGDYTTTFCLAASKAMRKNPREVAKILTEHMDLSDTYFTSVEIAGPGFLNFRLGDKWYADVLTAVEEEKGDYGRDNWLGGKKYMVEFVSANPTGPMHMGNARGGVLGDTLAEVLDWSGADVWREFYVNDFGNQIEKFAKSIEARYIQLIKGEDAIEFPEDGYHGDDIRELAKAFYDIHGDSYLEKSVEERHADMARFGLERNIPKMKSDLERYGIKFDEWFFESSLHNSGYVKDTVEELHKLGWTYEKEGALWLKTADIMREQYRKQGKKDEDIDKLDLKDDVLRRANGFYTYFAGDIAYHRNKFAVRHFDKVINVWGADHHGHVARMKGAMDALGLDGTNRLDIVLMQLVKLVRDGEVVRMSKRTGKTISLSDLLDEIPVDACRYFFNAKPDTQMEFDLGLAVRWALAHGYRRLVMAGALGGRLDQTIASLQTLRGLTDAGAQGWLIGCGADDWAGGSSRYILSESSSSQSGLIRGNLRRIFCSRSKPGLFRPARIWEIQAGLIPSSSASWLGFNPSFFIKSSNFSLISRIFYKYKYLFFVKQAILSFVKC